MPRQFDFTQRGESRKAKANRKERQAFDALGGDRRPASGALLNHKGDGELCGGKYLVDLKSTDGSAILISRKMLVKIDQEATAENKVPCVLLDFEKMPLGVGRYWAVVPAETITGDRE